jgi:hemolysin activation/secretion protein
MEWVMPMFLVPPSWQLSGSDTSLRHQVEPVLFADIGGGKIKDPESWEPKNKFLAGVGVGMKVHFNRNFTGRLDWAWDVGDDPAQGSDSAHFYMTFQLEI